MWMMRATASDLENKEEISFFLLSKNHIIELINVVWVVSQTACATVVCVAVFSVSSQCLMSLGLHVPRALYFLGLVFPRPHMPCIMHPQGFILSRSYISRHLCSQIRRFPGTIFLSSLSTRRFCVAFPVFFIYIIFPESSFSGLWYISSGALVSAVTS